MAAYYNEHDFYAAQWLRNLAYEGLIADGEVDQRSIMDVEPSDLVGFDQCHFFAGIGGWSLALRLAGWSDARSAWTGSCPCQPFSAAGRGAGMADERHLWPAFYDLIRACRPGVVFGEQVASAAVVGGSKPLAGPAWLDVVFDDLEAAHYACGAADIPAAGVGAPHIRQRLWWVGVADADCERRSKGRCDIASSEAASGEGRLSWARDGQSTGILADSLGPRLERRDARALGHEREAAERGGAAGGVGDAGGQGRGQVGSDAGRGGEGGGAQGVVKRPLHELARDPWSDLDWLPCRDGKTRPTRPGLFPLAHGISGRVGRLRGAGNAIVPQAGAAFVRAVMECMP